MIYVGTSGFGYHEWSASFYPRGLCYADYLAYYASHFRCCELTTTFFRMPSVRETARLIDSVPESFRFTAKLHCGLTHERDPDLRAARAFAEGISPLTGSGRLAAVLAQFPFSFINNPHGRAYLCRLRAALELPMVAELRNDTWLRPETISFLRGWGIGLAGIDAPSLGRFMPPTAIATSNVGYVRFHGRNQRAWWRARDRDRYDYRYRRRELLSWTPRIREIAKHCEDTFVIFNNRRHAHAVRNALMMAKLLARRKASAPVKARAG